MFTKSTAGLFHSSSPLFDSAYVFRLLDRAASFAVCGLSPRETQPPPLQAQSHTTTQRPMINRICTGPHSLPPGMGVGDGMSVGFGVAVGLVVGLDRPVFTVGFGCRAQCRGRAEAPDTAFQSN